LRGNGSIRKWRKREKIIHEREKTPDGRREEPNEGALGGGLTGWVNVGGRGKGGGATLITQKKLGGYSLETAGTQRRLRRRGKTKSTESGNVILKAETGAQERKKRNG